MVVLMTTVAILSSCYSDDGNYDYLSKEDAGEITIDTIGIENRMALSGSLTPGQRVVFEPNVHYKYPEHLRFRWFVLTLNQGSYQPIQNVMSWSILLPIPSPTPRSWIGW